jgi:hypothetical protein
MTRKVWTEAMISERIMDNYRSTGLMPTNQYLKDTGQMDLANQISKKGGFFNWAERLGLSRGHSDSDTGWFGEKEVQKILESAGFQVERSSAVKWPFDLLVNRVLRVDVKSANFACYGPCKGWFYRLGKAPQADLIALYQLDTKKIYWIPWNIVPHSNITISKDGGKWANYKDSIWIVQNMVETRKLEFEKLSSFGAKTNNLEQ